MFEKAIQSWSTESFRVCVRCGAFSFAPLPVLCRSCDFELQRWRLPKLIASAGLEFPVHALYGWTDDSDKILRPILYSFKGGRCPAAVAGFARAFTWAYTGSLQNAIFVVPPRKTEAPDHAYIWASALAKIWNGPVVDILEFEEGQTAESQKLKSADRRSERAFKQVKNANYLKQQRVIFADDILTTGATARAAYNALGKPRSFEVWAIAWRPKLARAEPF